MTNGNDCIIVKPKDMAGMTTEKRTGIVALGIKEVVGVCGWATVLPIVQRIDHNPLPGTSKTSLATYTPAVLDVRHGCCTVPLLVQLNRTSKAFENKKIAVRQYSQ